MNLDDMLNSRQVVNEEKFEEGRSAQEHAAPFIMEIMRKLDHEAPDELALDFFFYTNERSKAEDLAEVLRKVGYEVMVGENSERDLKYSVIGCTMPIPAKDSVVLSWSKQMNELGYIHDCQFDGWGTSAMKGGWFSDYTPEEELRKRLGMPPREGSDAE